MAYRLKRDETVADGIRRITAQEADSASQLLRHSTGSARDRAIHEARKSIKKLRALLTLIGPSIGRSSERENRRLRSAGRGLSPLRDAAALLESFEALVQHQQIAANTAALVRRELLDRKLFLERELDVHKLSAIAVATLQKTCNRTGQWPLANHDDGSLLARGLRRAYRRCRRAIRRAERRNDATSFHDFRKRVKEHWYHLRLVADLSASTTQARLSSLKKLETLLGDDHNLSVLRETVAHNPAAFGGDTTVEQLLPAIGSAQNQLRRQALALGHRLYTRKPRAFTRLLTARWQTQ